MLLFMINLVVYHLYIMMTNQTTNENVKSTYDQAINFNRLDSWLLNLAAVWRDLRHKNSRAIEEQQRYKKKGMALSFQKQQQQIHNFNTNPVLNNED